MNPYNTHAHFVAKHAAAAAHKKAQQQRNSNRSEYVANMQLAANSPRNNAHTQEK